MNETLARRSIWYGIAFSFLAPVILLALLAQGGIPWYYYEHNQAGKLKFILLSSLAIQALTARGLLLYARGAKWRVLAWSLVIVGFLISIFYLYRLFFPLRVGFA